VHRTLRRMGRGLERTDRIGGTERRQDTAERMREAGRRLASAGRRGPGRRMWIGGLAAHLTWFGLAMAGGPHVRPFIVFLAIAAAMYIEETVRRRVATDRPGAAEADHGL